MKAFLKYLTLFLVGGAFYYAMDVLFRGYSFLAMVGCGGLCFIICGVLNEKDRCMPLVLQMAIAACGITAIEFAFGLVLNVWLGLGMWDYSNMPFNLLGQICLPFSILWFLLSAIAVVLDDWIRHLLWGEEMPRYKLF